MQNTTNGAAAAAAAAEAAAAVDSSDGSGSDESPCCSDNSSDIDASLFAEEEGDSIPGKHCLDGVTAAAEVLAAVMVFHPCEHAQKDQLVRLPVLLLCSAVAGLRVFGADALLLVRGAVGAIEQMYGLRVHPIQGSVNGPSLRAHYRYV